MRRLASVGVLILVLVSSPGLAKDGDDPRDAAKKDLAQLQGAWSLVAMEAEGRSLDPEVFEGWGSVYEGDRLILKAKDEIRRRGIVTLDPAQTPKAMNTWDLDGPFQDQTVPGIYLLDGDTLKLCFARPGEKRPTELTTRSGTGFLVVVYKRQKP
jgi:uncharacterized protein (TIGR03067 family)